LEAVITLITVLGGTFSLEILRKKSNKTEIKMKTFIRHDCKDRILKLEALLENSSREKDEMRADNLETYRTSCCI
jgi:hypothetical protein